MVQHLTNVRERQAEAADKQQSLSMWDSRAERVGTSLVGPAREIVDVSGDIQHLLGTIRIGPSDVWCGSSQGDFIDRRAESKYAMQALGVVSFE